MITCDPGTVRYISAAIIFTVCIVVLVLAVKVTGGHERTDKNEE